MTKECAGKIVKKLMAFFPREYPDDMKAEKINTMIEGFMTSYAGFDDSLVLMVYQELIDDSPFSPKVADVRKRLKERKEYYERTKTEMGPKIRTPEDNFEHCVRDGIKYRIEFVENYTESGGISYDGVRLVPIGKVIP